MPRITPDISEIVVREGSTPTRTFRLYDDAGAPVDVSAYQITLTVKPFLAHPDGESGLLPDSRVLFNLNASSLTADGYFSFVFGKAHTYRGYREWPAEVRWYEGGAPASGDGPSDSVESVFRVVPAVDNDPT